MSIYVYCGDIENWTASHPEVVRRARLAAKGRKWEFALAGNDGLWIELI
jgi:hypothetical protein